MLHPQIEAKGFRRPADTYIAAPITAERDTMKIRLAIAAGALTALAAALAYGATAQDDTPAPEGTLIACTPYPACLPTSEGGA